LGKVSQRAYFWPGRAVKFYGLAIQTGMTISHWKRAEKEEISTIRGKAASKERRNREMGTKGVSRKNAKS